MQTITNGRCRCCQILRWRRLQCDQIWRKFTTLAKLWNSLAILGGLISFLQNFNLANFGKHFVKVANFHCCKRPKIENNNLAIWSHWSTASKLKSFASQRLISLHSTLWSENTHLGGSLTVHTGDLLFDWFGFNNTTKYVDNKAAKSEPVKQEVSRTVILPAPYEVSEHSLLWSCIRLSVYRALYSFRSFVMEASSKCFEIKVFSKLKNLFCYFKISWIPLPIFCMLETYMPLLDKMRIQ